MNQPSGNAEPRRILKSWHLIAVAIIATATIIHYLLEWNVRRKECRNLVEVARSYRGEDNFEKSLESLDKAIDRCGQDNQIEMERLETKTFKVAVEYDQVKLVKNKSVLTEIDQNWRILTAGLDEREIPARLLALRGILEELRDRPRTAIEKYYRPAHDKDATYANVYNYWGYTIYKWELGGPAWAERSLELFSQAANHKPDYAMPHINTAAVWLDQGELARAEESLKKAERLLPDNPRV